MDSVNVPLQGKRPWDKEIIQNYWVDQYYHKSPYETVRERFEDSTLLVLKTGKKAMSQGIKQPLNTWSDKKTDSTLKTADKIQSWQPALHFWPLWL